MIQRGNRRPTSRDGYLTNVTTLKGHTGGVMCGEFSSDGRRVATASEDFSIKVWDLVGADVPAAPKGSKKTKLSALIVGE